MPDSAEAIIALCYTLTAICVSSIGIPQTVSLIRRWRSGDGLQLFRLLWVVLMGSLCVLAISRALVWADISLFDQAMLGAIARRWPMELVIAMLIAAASLYAAILYWRVRAEAAG